MTTTQTALDTPASLFSLRERARVTVDGRTWVVYDEPGREHRWAVTADDFDGEIPEDSDYSEWCSGTTAAGDRALCARIAAAADLPGIWAAGISVFVGATAS